MTRKLDYAYDVGSGRVFVNQIELPEGADSSVLIDAERGTAIVEIEVDLASFCYTQGNDLGFLSNSARQAAEARRYFEERSARRKEQSETASAGDKNTPPQFEAAHARVPEVIGKTVGSEKEKTSTAKTGTDLTDFMAALLKNIYTPPYDMGPLDIPGLVGMGRAADKKPSQEAKPKDNRRDSSGVYLPVPDTLRSGVIVLMTIEENNRYLAGGQLVKDLVGPWDVVRHMYDWTQREMRDDQARRLNSVSATRSCSDQKMANP